MKLDWIPVATPPDLPQRVEGNEKGGVWLKCSDGTVRHCVSLDSLERQQRQFDATHWVWPPEEARGFAGMNLVKHLRLKTDQLRRLRVLFQQRKRYILQAAAGGPDEPWQEVDDEIDRLLSRVRTRR